MTVLKPEDVAAEFSIGRAQVVARCKAQEWPHLKVGRKFLFTPEHLEQIKALCEVKPAEPAPADSWGVVSRGSA